MNHKLESLRQQFSNDLSMTRKEWGELVREIEAETTPEERSLLRKLFDSISR